MVRKGVIRKESLKDSLKLNRDRLERMNDEEADMRSCGEFKESKYVHDEENWQSGNITTRSTDSIRSKQDKLLNYLDTVKSKAEGEREQAFERASSSSYRQRKKFDWERDEDECDLPLGPTSSDDFGDCALAPQYDDSVSIGSRRSRGIHAEESLSSFGAGTSVASSRSKLLSLKLELEEKTKTVSALKRALEKSRVEKSHIMEKSNETVQQALETQRQDHEKAVARHLAFIDKLLSDKKQLAGKVEELSARIRKMEDSTTNKVRILEEKHSRDLAKAKETMASIDASKRQKWQREKTKELKELTIKGLEPEIENILAKHKEDLRIVEDKFKEEVRSVRDQSEQEKLRALKDMRTRCDIELDEMRSKERGSLGNKLGQMEARHQKELEDQRARYEKEFDDLRKRHKVELRDTQAQLQDRVAETTKHKEQQLLEQKRRLELQLDTLEQKWAIEKEQWQAKVINKVQEKTKTEERKLKERLTAERDKQIDAVISKLYAEQESKTAQLFDQHREELERAEAKSKDTIRALEEKIDDWRIKYSEIRDSQRADKKTFSSAESRVRDLETLAEKREARIVELSQKVASINDIVAEREREIRDEYAERNRHHVKQNAETQDLVQSLREKLAAEAASRKQQITKMQSDFEEETDEIHRRVRLTVSRKDDTIQALRAQLDEMQQQFEGYNELLEKQRQEFVG